MPRVYQPLETGDYKAAMTFDEIAAAMGTKRQWVWVWYANGIRKLRRKGVKLAQLRELASELQRERDRRETGNDW